MIDDYPDLLTALRALLAGAITASDGDILEAAIAEVERLRSFETENGIEQIARSIAVGRGIDPDKNLNYGEKPSWQYFVDDARIAMRCMRPA